MEPAYLFVGLRAWAELPFAPWAGTNCQPARPCCSLRFLENKSNAGGGGIFPPHKRRCSPHVEKVFGELDFAVPGLRLRCGGGLGCARQPDHNSLGGVEVRSHQHVRRHLPTDPPASGADCALAEPLPKSDARLFPKRKMFQGCQRSALPGPYGCKKGGGRRRGRRASPTRGRGEVEARPCARRTPRRQKLATSAGKRQPFCWNSV